MPDPPVAFADSGVVKPTHTSFVPIISPATGKAFTVTEAVPVKFVEIHLESSSEEIIYTEFSVGLTLYVKEVFPLPEILVVEVFILVELLYVKVQFPVATNEPVIVILSPLQIEVFMFVIDAVGLWLTVIVTSLELKQPVVLLVSVKVYVWVEIGFTSGFDSIDENPLGFEIQEYVLPLTAIDPILIFSPLQISVEEITEAIGAGFTVTFKYSSLELPPSR